MTAQVLHTSDANPLLDVSGLPKFESFHVEHIAPAVETVISENLAAIDALVADDADPTWETFVVPLERLHNRFERVWGPIGHLDGVKNSDLWHEAYTGCLDIVSDYSTRIGQNKGLFDKFRQLANMEAYKHYSLAQKKVIEDALRDFKLSGIDLPAEQQGEYKRISQRLSQLSSAFGNNVLKGTQAWSKLVTDESELAGLPDASMGLLAQLAEQKDQKGWLVTLDIPSYLAVMTYADNRDLREEVYQAFATRASDQADNTEFDNSPLMPEILQLRHQKAQLLGFESSAELSLATKMAGSTDAVFQFLNDLAEQSKPQAEKELAALKAFAQKELGLQNFLPWDVAYASEKYKQATLNLSKEALKPYFPVTKVIEGLFAVTERLFGVRVREKSGVPVWHQDVRYFELVDEADKLKAGFYLDLYAREHKRGGAWMDSAISRWQDPKNGLQVPVAYLVCNFTPPVGDTPACLTHDEVTTLFHEFGHGLHHMLTEMDHFDVSGINGVPWDAVELPSQFMENFCWEREGIDLMTAHVDTGETLPDEWLARLRDSRGFQSAMMMVRQLEFSLFDFGLHAQKPAEDSQAILAHLDKVREQVAVVIPPDYHRFPHSFAHIFAGGYAAGYYSYKWAEVLSADAFSLFEETGILNPDTGARFKNTILAAGGSVNPMALFKQFRGREPKIDALLRHTGIKAA
ncbi:MAG: M3 family metallopeptidase [Hydrogenovibrio sp.]|uniref:M3 family metallopeptidase n=1 Tax=Hydrogenovibrio sp. TaxID=2065821 RepID=UPI00286FDC1E|nr:M3 family metallopeptidase [Hydrogenovibrio sp.]MDR9498240.1 M3 family metallopeptidase [Hydrogenovibrio sp.]